MTAHFKSIMRAERRGHVEVSTEVKNEKVYVTGVYRRAKAHRGLTVGYHRRLNNGKVERFIPYGM